MWILIMSACAKERESIIIAFWVLVLKGYAYSLKNGMNEND